MCYCLCLPHTSLSHILFCLFDDTLKMWKSSLACELSNTGVKAIGCQLLCPRAAAAGPGCWSELQTPAQHSITICVLGTVKSEKHYAAILLFPLSRWGNLIFRDVESLGKGHTEPGLKPSSDWSQGHILYRFKYNCKGAINSRFHVTIFKVIWLIQNSI